MKTHRCLQTPLLSAVANPSFGDRNRLKETVLVSIARFSQTDIVLKLVAMRAMAHHSIG
jgi:hypothetical protein